MRKFLLGELMTVISFAVIIMNLGIFYSSAKANAVPEVLLTDSNQPPSCVTPERLLKFIKLRNPYLRPKFKNIAIYYIKYGNLLNVRWDFAFFQMLLETDFLKFTGDVHWSQNNFSGLGATGNGVRGERFTSVSDGVKAHLEHLLIYAGVHVKKPIAVRTRKVQSWKILSNWRRSIKGPITFRNIGQKWAPSTPNYANNIESIGKNFDNKYCKRRASKTIFFSGVQKQKIPKFPAGPSRALLGASLVNEDMDRRNSFLSVGELRTYMKKNEIDNSVVKLSQNQNKKVTNSLHGFSKSNRDLKTKAILMPRISKSKFKEKYQIHRKARYTDSYNKNEPKCSVWTASHGGEKTILIRSMNKNYINYTALDVNPDNEKLEMDAYIAAYARGGKKISEYKSRALALDQAFKLCPGG